MRSTHTYAIMEVPREVFEVVKAKLEDAGYQHAIHDGDTLDMHGVALRVAESTVKKDG